MRKKGGPQAVSYASIPHLESLADRHDFILIDDLRVGDDFLKEHFTESGDDFVIVRVESSESVKMDLDVELEADYVLMNTGHLAATRDQVRKLIGALSQGE